MIGRTLGHYRVTTSIGAGGMGEVYRATDTKLGRDVALKVLPADVAGDPERLERFQREAKALAALDHPNIVTIHSVEETGGVHFLTMQLVEGQPLDRLIPEGGLPVDRLLAIGEAIADALAAAHDRSIVHRDLKPANVMVTPQGRVKVLDFGLAKVVDEGARGNVDLATALQTRDGVVMGTVPYMSPEQVAGRTVDLRTDIFSLGVILYELASGQRPFKGDSSAELASAILRDTPPPLGEVRPDLPADLARTIRRCLEKDAPSRIQTARDVGNELRDLARAPAPTRTLEARRAGGPNFSSARKAEEGKEAGSGAARLEEGFWVAVLPFKYAGGNADLTALAEGLCEEIVTGLSRFSYLRVTTPSSAARGATEGADARSAGVKLGARYVMEGSLRQSGTRLRIAVQLVDTTSGAHLWAETYDRPFSAEAVFELQDDVVPRIVSTVADWYGVLPRSMSEALRSKSPEQLSPYESVLRSFGYYARVTAEEHAAARAGLERAVAQAPGYADAWAMLSMMYGEEYRFGFNALPDPLGRALQAARRAADAAPSNNYAYLALGAALFFRKEFPAFRSAAEQAIALNPMDGSTVEYMGHLMAFAGDWEKGCAVAERARQLNPHHPGWYWATAFYDTYRKGDYRGALPFALKVNNPNLLLFHVMVAAVYGQLGEREPARHAVRALLDLDPNFAGEAREALEKWYPGDLVEQLIDGLRKAGLEIQGEKGKRGEGGKEAGSGAARREEGFWVAVLPFRYTGANADLTALAEGLTEEIVTGLSRFSYLRVIAHSSTARYATATADVRAVGNELGARYVMEGSLRQAGSVLRVAVQLVDASSGAHLWAETYTRPFDPEGVFVLQDDLVPRIVSTVADRYGVLPHTLSESVWSKPANELSPYEAVLRSFGYYERANTAEDHAAIRGALERAVQQAPGYADAWAMLSMMYAEEYGLRINPQLDPLGRALQAARRAADAAPSNHSACLALAQALFFRKEFPAFRVAAERAIALNPMDGSTVEFISHLMAFAGDWEHGCELAEQARQLNPHHPGWYWATGFYGAYRKGDYRGALGFALKMNMPGFLFFHVMLAAVYGQLGDGEAAGHALRELLAVEPDFVRTGRGELEKWYLPDLVEQLMDGIRKAGLETQDEEAKKGTGAGSGAARLEEGFWVAVLPFRFTGANADLTALAEGLTEEIVTGLSRFSYLRVIAHSSTARYANSTTDVRAVGQELGARYVMEGSLRQAGTRLRLSVQLVDTGSGAHLWAETYDRLFGSEEIFALQDDLVSRVVSTTADTQGVLPHIMSEALRSRDPDELTPYEAVLRSFAHFQRANAEEHAASRAALERAVRQAPGYADAWAMLSLIYKEEFTHEFNLRPDPVGRAFAAARRASEAAPSNHLAYHALAAALFFRRELQPFRSAAERALTLNPMDGFTLAYLGFLIAYSGDWERGCALAERARSLNPSHPGWYWFPAFFDAYRKSNYRGALDVASKVNMPGFWRTQLALATSYGQLSEREAARAALRSLLALRPDFAERAHEELGKWWDPALVLHLIDGLRKAGMELPPASSSSPSGA